HRSAPPQRARCSGRLRCPRRFAPRGPLCPRGALPLYFGVVTVRRTRGAGPSMVTPPSARISVRPAQSCVGSTTPTTCTRPPGRIGGPIARARTAYIVPLSPRIVWQAPAISTTTPVMSIGGGGGGGGGGVGWQAARPSAATSAAKAYFFMVSPLIDELSVPPIGAEKVRDITRSPSGSQSLPEYSNAPRETHPRGAFRASKLLTWAPWCLGAPSGAAEDRLRPAR